MIIENFIEDQTLIRVVAGLDYWPVSNNGTGRKVVHFGYTYGYRNHALTKTTPIPECLNFDKEISQVLGMDIKFDQLIVNRYEPGQSIASHIDDTKFGPVIACISLGETGIIKFDNGAAWTCPDRSLYVMFGEYRTRWKHSYRNTRQGTRYSLTYRSCGPSSHG